MVGMCRYPDRGSVQLISLSTRVVECMHRTEFDPRGLTVFIDEQGYDMADEVDKYDEKDVSVHFCLYAQDDPEKAERGEKGVPAGTVRVVKSSLKVSFDQGFCPFEVETRGPDNW